jgi:hypothetical protein
MPTRQTTLPMPSLAFPRVGQAQPFMNAAPTEAGSVHIVFGPTIVVPAPAPAARAPALTPTRPTAFPPVLATEPSLQAHGPPPVPPAPAPLTSSNQNANANGTGTHPPSGQTKKRESPSCAKCGEQRGRNGFKREESGAHMNKLVCRDTGACCSRLAQQQKQGGRPTRSRKNTEK